MFCPKVLFPLLYFINHALLLSIREVAFAREEESVEDGGVIEVLLDVLPNTIGSVVID